MIDALVGLVTRILLATGLFWAILLVGFCAHTPQRLEEKRAAECPVFLRQATVTIANQLFTIPAGPNTHIKFDAYDRSRTHIAWARRNEQRQFVFCENDIVARPDAKQVRIGKEVLQQAMGASALTGLDALHSVYFGTERYLPMGGIPEPFPTGSYGAEAFVAVETQLPRSTEQIMMTAGWLDPGIRIWTACNESLINGDAVCSVGILRQIDGMTAYLGNVSPSTFPRLNEPAAPEIVTAAAFLTNVLTEFRLRGD